MSKRGRKSVYDTVIFPNINKIEEWVKSGATEKQICEALGISVSAFNVHKEKMELKEALKKGRSSLVLDLRSEMIKKAFKHTLETKKTYVTQDENGSTRKHTEITTKEVDGDTGALHLLLKNYDKDNWKNDWDSYELKQAELELKKKLADDKDWNI
jgi:hypothetical protein|nr:MAG TPA: terminase small subunit [Bacteriophage sp.]DAP51599.1 MAG TPA: terminase small subunit [Caudoviricetes sp.]